MKIQCSCGAKYEFEVSPDMVQQPVRFVCPACGRDSSNFVNQLVRQHFGVGTAAPPAAVPASSATPAPPSATPAVRLAHPVHEAAVPTIAEPGEQLCAKHPGEIAGERCYVCSKPICPKCMQLFGYVCSPLCRAKAEARGIAIPEFAGQKSVMERKFWRKVGWGAGALGSVALLLLGFWFWWAWFGSMPRVIFTAAFNRPAYAGQSWPLGSDRLAVLHGGVLALYDVKSQKQLWERTLIDHKRIEEAAAAEIKAEEAAAARAYQDDPERKVRIASLDEVIANMEKAASAELELRVQGQNVWVLSPGKLTRYAADTGNPAQEMPLRSSTGELLARGSELLLLDTGGATQSVTHINLGTCETRSEDLGASPEPNAPRPPPPSGNSRAATPGGLPVGMPGQEAGLAMDPEKVARQAQRLSRPAKIALPALLANSMHQEQLLDELNDQPKPQNPAAATPAPAAEESALLPSPDGFVEYRARLLESRIVRRSAMKAPPAKSVLDGELSVSKTTEAANEILNEMQRSRGGDIIEEDESRYRVKLSTPDGKQSWSGEVTGPPRVFPLQSVTVVSAGKSLIVLDKAMRKVWEKELSFNLNGALGGLNRGEPDRGQGPCVERNGLLYVFDEGTLSVFDLASGARHWSLPSVGITSLFFDNAGSLYVNTTTAGLDKLRYSRQIDISDVTSDVSMKVDAKSGRPMWTRKLGGNIAYVSGSFVYSLETFESDDDLDSAMPTKITGLGPPTHMRIRRINPRNGDEMWEYYQDRLPLDVEFEKNTIRLVFKKEAQVLQFRTL